MLRLHEREQHCALTVLADHTRVGDGVRREQRCGRRHDGLSDQVAAPKERHGDSESAGGLDEVYDGLGREGGRKESAVGPITPKELARQLRLLEGSGLIHRRVFPTVPPRVEYSLTELGISLYPTLESLAKWGSHHGGAVRARRPGEQVRSE